MLRFDRRRFVNLTAASAATSLITASGIVTVEAAPRVKAIAFDGFVIFDPRPIRALTEDFFPGRGASSATPGERANSNIRGCVR